MIRPKGWPHAWQLMPGDATRLAHDTSLIVAIDSDGLARAENPQEWRAAIAGALPEHAVNAYFAELLQQAIDVFAHHEAKRAYDEAKQKLKPNWKPKTAI